MNQLIKLAWRNIWRKKRRSVITMLSVIFAVVISVNFRSLQWGAYDKMIEAGTKNSGYLQVQSQDYWEDKSINELIEDHVNFRNQISSVPGISSVIPRLQNFSLAASESSSKGALVIGIDPESENQYNELNSRVIKGSYLSENENAVIIAEGLSNYLKLKVNDTLVLVSQGYHASIAAGKYPIKGIVKLPNPQMNRMTAYLPLTTAQAFNGAEGLVNAFMLNVSDRTQVNATQLMLQDQLGPAYAIMRWDEMHPEIQKSINTDTTIATLLLSALYLIVGFGIIGTIVMMALERKREFGMLQAIGLQKSQIQTVILLESLMLGVIGVILAWLIAFPIVNFMHNNPIPLTGEGAKSFEAMGVEPVIQFAIKPHLFALMGLIIFLIMLVASAFPLTMIRKLKMSEVIK
ncbi:MAG: ABC transporter permease [Cytophagales bacterium]|nr:ABC transporter permease [Cytophagales bacterium]